MTDTWAAKVLEGVERYNSGWRSTHGEDIRYADALAAIAKLAEGDGLVERLHVRHGKTNAPWEDGWTYSVSDGFIVHKRGPAAMTFSLEVGLQEFVAATSANAAAHIAALTAQNREMALDVLASSGQAQEAYAAQLAAEAERDALRERVALLEGAADRVRAASAIEHARASQFAAEAKVARLEGAVMWARDAMETCGNCMGSGYSGHPDSGAVCADCNGSGGVRAALTDGAADE